MQYPDGLSRGARVQALELDLDLLDLQRSEVAVEPRRGRARRRRAHAGACEKTSIGGQNYVPQKRTFWWYRISVSLASSVVQNELSTKNAFCTTKDAKESWIWCL